MASATSTDKSVDESMSAFAAICLSATSAFLGMHMAASMTQVSAGPVDGTILSLGAVALGGVLGEWVQLDARLARLGGRLSGRQRGTNTTTEGMIAAFLLFCIGPLTLLGSLSNGLTGNSQLLLIKAALDGTAAIALPCSFGASVGWSVLPLVVVQAGLSLTAGLLSSIIPHPETDPAILLMSGIGGLLLLGLALGLLDITRIRLRDGLTLARDGVRNTTIPMRAQGSATEAADLAAATAGDAEAFGRLTQPSLRELHLHCYRLQCTNFSQCKGCKTHVQCHKNRPRNPHVAALSVARCRA